jgi:acyl transferase domain-containing protein
MIEKDFAHSTAHEIAVIGMAGRFPGASDIEDFWRNLCDGVESISFFTEAELRASGVSPSVLEDPRYVRAAGNVKGVELFDARFFGLSPSEASITDPQQRLLLECAWEALERAGYAPGACAGPVGVYVGADLSTYLLNNLSPLLRRADQASKISISLFNSSDSLATRISYKLNLTGPSVSVQTACSTSLVAVHMACLALQSYECDMVLAGGAYLPIPQQAGYLYEEGGPFSPDGHIRAFDAGAGGTVIGSGVGIVVLKRLDESLRDGDFIHAIIKGSAINNDGSNKVGYTAPSVDGQIEAIEAAHAMAGVAPDSITYVETHGTGTRLGDPIEIAALTKAFGAEARRGSCAIGSVKTNIGHASSAAGVIGLIKACLCLEHGRIPPSLHFERANPDIDFEHSPFFVNTELRKWICDGPRRAGVSAFGLGGTNAHVVVEEAPAAGPPEQARSWHLFVISAKTSAALGDATVNLASHLRRNAGLEPADVAYTLQVGRASFEHRRMLVADTLESAAAALETLDPERVLGASSKAGDRPVAFLFPGGGSQYAAMGRDLYRREPIYRNIVDRCAETLVRQGGFDVRDALYPDPGNEAAALERMLLTSVVLPSLFVTEYAAAQLLMEWGIRPQAMLGHSLGEYVASCVAGVMSLDDTLALVTLRGRLIEGLPAGAMLAIPLPEPEIRPTLGGDLSIAAINSPSSCVVSGDLDAVARLEQALLDRGVEPRRLRVAAPGHSKQFEPLGAEITRFVRRIRLNAPAIPYISNVSGTWITPEEATDPTYWARHLARTVRFADGVAELLREPSRILVEVGPGHTLCSLVRQHHDLRPEQLVVSTMRHRDEPRSDDEFLLTTVGRLWLAGRSADWRRYHDGERRRRLPLPTYPFHRERCWIEPSNAPSFPQAVPQTFADRRPDIADWFYTVSWKRTMRPRLPDGITGSRACWLIFEDACGLGALLARALEDRGQTVVRVTARKGASGSAAGFTIDPRKEKHYDRLARDLRSAGLIPNRIVHLWSISDGDRGAGEKRTFDGRQIPGFYSLLHIGRMIPELVVSEPLRIDVVSSGLFAVTGSERVVPEKATLLGPSRVIPLEYPNVQCRNIDISLGGEDEAGIGRLAERLTAELMTESSDLAVAYRNGGRWARIYDPARLPEAPAGLMPLREGGAYLITAGLGGVGFEIARFIARSVRCSLLLVGRTVLPPRDQWERIIGDAGVERAVREKLSKVLALEKLGAEVVPVDADVSDDERMAAVVDRAREQYGKVDGVIHSAAVRGGGLIDVTTVEEIEREFDPKIRGLYVLEKLLRNPAPDFIILCSSINAFAPFPGGVAYAAANSFLDSYATARSAAGGTRWISINWPLWRNVGFAATPEGERLSRATGGSGQGMNADEGVNAFGRILYGCTAPQVIVSPEDIRFYLAAKLKFNTPGEQDGRPAGSSPGPGHARPDLQTSYVAPRTDTERRLAAIWGEVLGIDGIGVHDSFFDLGGNSLMATLVMSRVREMFRTNMTVRELFHAPTVAGLGEKLLEKTVAEIDPAALDAMVSDIRNLSDEDVRKALEADAGAKEPAEGTGKAKRNGSADRRKRSNNG